MIRHRYRSVASFCRTLLALTVLISAGCIESKPQLSDRYRQRIEDAVRGIVPDGEKIHWEYIDLVERNGGFTKVQGRFWARLRRQKASVSHEVVATINDRANDIQWLLIDRTSYENDQLLSEWSDGEHDHDPEEKFSHLTDEEKNELWWDINRRVVRKREIASTTITWDLHGLIQLTNRYRVSPLEISEFFEFGKEADWRTAQRPPPREEEPEEPEEPVTRQQPPTGRLTSSYDR